MMYNWNKIINKTHHSKKYSPNHRYIYWGKMNSHFGNPESDESNSYLIFNNANAQNGLRK